MGIGGGVFVMSEKCPTCNGLGFLYDPENSKLPEIKPDANGMVPINQDAPPITCCWAFVVCPDCSNRSLHGVLYDKENS